MILELQLDIDAIDREMDALIAVRDVVARRLDVLAQHRETKMQMLAFESTEYTHLETMPVNFFRIEDDSQIVART